VHPVTRNGDDVIKRERFAAHSSVAYLTNAFVTFVNVVWIHAFSCRRVAPSRLITTNLFASFLRMSRPPFFLVLENARTVPRIRGTIKYSQVLSIALAGYTLRVIDAVSGVNCSLRS
jgi:hypothetical protein